MLAIIAVLTASSNVSVQPEPGPKIETLLCIAEVPWSYLHSSRKTSSARCWTHRASEGILSRTARNLKEGARTTALCTEFFRGFYMSLRDNALLCLFRVEGSGCLRQSCNCFLKEGRDIVELTLGR